MAQLEHSGVAIMSYRKLTAKQVAVIRRYCSRPPERRALTYAQVAARFGVSTSTISYVMTNRYYRNPGVAQYAFQRETQLLPTADIADAETLGQMLQLLTESDEALVSLTPAQLEQLGAQLAQKVDAYKYVEEKMEAEIARLDSRIKAFQKAKKSLVGAYDRLKDLLAHHMDTKGFPRLPGVDYVACLGHSTSVRLRREYPTAADAVSLPEFVRVSYAWDKKAISDALKAESPTAADVAELVSAPWVTFDVNKGKINADRKSGRKAGIPSASEGAAT